MQLSSVQQQVKHARGHHQETFPPLVTIICAQKLSDVGISLKITSQLT